MDVRIEHEVLLGHRFRKGDVRELGLSLTALRAAASTCARAKYKEENARLGLALIAGVHAANLPNLLEKGYRILLRSAFSARHFETRVTHLQRAQILVLALKVLRTPDPLPAEDACPGCSPEGRRVPLGRKRHSVLGLVDPRLGKSAGLALTDVGEVGI